MSGVSSASVKKLGRNENVNTDLLAKICTALKYDIADIIEKISAESKSTK